MQAQNGDQDRARCAGADPALAISGCTAIIQAGHETNDSLAVVFHYRGNAYLERGDPDHAIADFAQAIRLNPNLPQSFYDRGRAWFAKKDYRRAIADFDQVIALNPDIPEVYDMRGAAYYGGGDADRAGQDYDQAIMLDAMYAPAFVHRGNLYSAKGDYDRALKDYDEAIRLNPRYAEAWHGRGEAYFRKADYARAAADLDQSLKLDPDNADAVWRRVVTRFTLGQFAQAAEDAEHSAKLNPAWSYGTLWRYIANVKSGMAKPGILLPYNGRIDISKWPGPILALYAGALTAAQVSDAAKAAGGRSGAGETCEAAFYIGELRLLRNDPNGARESLQAAVRTCPHSFDEYHAAVAELRRLQ
ncbi:MAG TPA: tetratricopeptide repeat protein [Micropepsaceae bacterium]|nr:tetratricopeptide repeat protein [Micropepsaceae bacterium]